MKFFAALTFVFWWPFLLWSIVWFVILEPNIFAWAAEGRFFFLVGVVVGWGAMLLIAAEFSKPLDKFMEPWLVAKSEPTKRSRFTGVI